jgi:beta-phosphoglucomutase-like phosphatase (HAD superfamily)
LIGRLTYIKAWRVAFERYGKNISPSSIRRQIGQGSDQLMSVFLTKKEIDQFGEELDKYRATLFKKQYLPYVKPFPKVRELFERLKEDRKRIALASLSEEDELKIYKKITRIEDLIEEGASSDDAENAKPEPDIFSEHLKDWAILIPIKQSLLATRSMT